MEATMKEIFSWQKPTKELAAQFVYKTLLYPPRQALADTLGTGKTQPPETYDSGRIRLLRCAAKRMHAKLTLMMKQHYFAVIFQHGALPLKALLRREETFPLQNLDDSGVSFSSNGLAHQCFPAYLYKE